MKGEVIEVRLRRRQPPRGNRQYYVGMAEKEMGQDWSPAIIVGGFFGSTFN